MTYLNLSELITMKIMVEGKIEEIEKTKEAFRVHLSKERLDELHNPNLEKYGTILSKLNDAIETIKHI